MKVFALTLLAALLLAPAVELHAAETKPAVIFLLTDDQTIGALHWAAFGTKTSSHRTSTSSQVLVTNTGPPLGRPRCSGRKISLFKPRKSRKEMTAP